MVRYLFYTIGDLTYQSPLVSQSTPCYIYRQVNISKSYFLLLSQCTETAEMESTFMSQVRKVK